MLRTNNRNLYLDLFKVVLSLMPITIHFGEKALTPLCRLAVPMFFMMSGYFLYRKNATPSQQMQGAKKYLLSAITYFFCAILFYFIYDVTLRLTVARDENLSNYFMYMYMPDIITNGLLLNRPVTTGFHLWFLLALLDVALIHILLVKFNKTRWYYFIAPIGLFLFFFFGEYTEKLVGTRMPTEYYRNGLIMGLPCAALGYTLARNRDENPKFYVKWIYLVLGVVCFALQYIEDMWQSQECYVSTIFSSAFLLLFFTGLKAPKCTFYYKYVGTALPYYIYVINIAVDNIIPDNLMTAKTVRPLLTLFVSIAMYEAAHLLVMLGKYLLSIYKNRGVSRRTA